MDTWTTSRRSTSPTAQPGTSGTGTTTPSYWYPTAREVFKTSIFKPRLIAGGRENKEGIQTFSFTPLNLFGYSPDEEELGDHQSKPRKVYLSQSSGKYSGCRLLGQFSPGTGRRTTILADKDQCRMCIQYCAGRLHLQFNFSERGNELYSRDSRRQVPQRRLYLRVLGNRSSSKTPLRVRLPVPGKWCRECRERNKVTQQITQNYPAPGNWSGVLSQVLRKSEGIAQDVILKDEEWMGQQAAASGSPQPVPASVVNPWLSANMWSSTWKLVRGNASSASIDGTLSRGKRDRDLESVQTLSERRNLRVHLEQKAELAVQGESAAQRRLSEAESDMNSGN